MPTDHDTRHRLRALDLRTEDVVLVRLLVGVVLRILGVAFVVYGVAQVVSVLGWLLPPGGGLGQTPPGQVAAFVAGPLVFCVAGATMFASSGPISHRMVPHRVGAPSCPGCAYTLTTLDRGRCPECDYLVSPLRDAPRSDADRLVVGRAIIALILRLIGIGLLLNGAGRLALQALAEVLLHTPRLAEDYATDRRFLWWAITLVIGMAVYTLADTLAGAALFGLRRAAKSPPKHEG